MIKSPIQSLKQEEGAKEEKMYVEEGMIDKEKGKEERNDKRRR